MQKQLQRTVRTILRHSHEGHDLNPADYIVVVRSIDTPPLDGDVRRINEIDEQLTAGTYPTYKDWFWGIENLQRRDDRKLYWRDTPVAYFHYAKPFDELDAAVELGRRCRYLEALGVRVTAQTTRRYWSWFAGIPKDHAYLALFAALPTIWERSTPDHMGSEVALMVKDNKRCVCVIWGPQGKGTCDPDAMLDTSNGWTIVDVSSMDWRELSRWLIRRNVHPDILCS